MAIFWRGIAIFLSIS